MTSTPTNDEQLRAEVSSRYARVALHVLGTEQTSADACCGPSCCTSDDTTKVPVQVEAVEQARASSCCESSCCSTSTGDGNPVTSDL